ncbi:UTP--glucose-1-phosphate uridylyltransferase GalU [Macrococcoides canis]|uniref:UTP--glucose-1-phosphate uridylyltransferase GalU n=1 Tax=Macrococcoides canis TaxID=1855823 RepID=UPI0013E90E83|nr:UTP--glucose-1-phosphate uridylyltransferase GalU [Macrococcus canis]QIH75554.1 UTP--glucose-1-phosphate uridylyltransferase GalU [Macrococcus canis]
MAKIKKAIIPAAGLGTRFLPATKAMPKEMLPIIDKPTIQYIIEEAIKSGIEDIIIVTGKGKRAIEDHFDKNIELEQNLIEKQKTELLEKVEYASSVDLHFIRQKEPKGLGHAIWCARKFIGNEPFAVLLGDDIVEAEEPCLKQMINIYEEKESSIIGVQLVPENETNRYGIISVEESISENLYSINNLVEKPLNNPPSNLAIMGRYILSPEIFTILGHHKIGAGGEIQLTDAITELNKTENVFAYKFRGKRYDVGQVDGYLLTILDFALKDEKYKSIIFEYLNSKGFKYED